MKRIKTKFTGVFYRESTTNGKADKTYYITYKNNKKSVETKIGKFSEGVREAYCNAKRNEIVTKIRLGEDLPTIAQRKQKKTTTVKELADLYFEYRELHNSKNLKNEKNKYENHIKPDFENKDIYTLTEEHIESLQRKKQKTLAPKTNNIVLDLFSTIINHAIAKKAYNGENFVSKVKRLKIDNTRERFLTKDEIKQLIDSIRDNKLLYLFCMLSLSTGGRINTILHIRKRDINTEHRTVSLIDLKNNNERYQGYISEDLAKYLSNYMEHLNDNDFIINVNNKQLSVSMLQKRLRPILNDLFNQELEENDRKNRFVIHSLRHTFASHLAINRTPIYTIQKLMNHKDINMTLRYAKLDPTNGKDMVDVVMGEIN